MIIDEQAIRNARNPEQARRMKILKERGLCYFCQRKNGEGVPYPNLVHEGEFWYITKNDWPLGGEIHFYMIVLKRHVQDEDQVNPQEAAEYASMLSWLKRHLGVKSYSTFTRNGDAAITGSSQEHLHKHFIVGGRKPADDDYQYPRDVVPVVIAYKNRV
jgi:diadenosine tetraphosphate (Ap4A) HIT family hydrolase